MAMLIRIFFLILTSFLPFRLYAETVLGPIMAVRRDVIVDQAECSKKMAVNPFQEDVFECSGGSRLKENEYLLPIGGGQTRVALNQPCEHSAFIATGRGLDNGSDVGQYVVTVKAGNLKEAKTCVENSELNKKPLWHF